VHVKVVDRGAVGINVNRCPVPRAHLDFVKSKKSSITRVTKEALVRQRDVSETDDGKEDQNLSDGSTDRKK
jgi:hypothetical protein